MDAMDGIEPEAEAHLASSVSKKFPVSVDAEFEVERRLVFFERADGDSFGVLRCRDPRNNIAGDFGVTVRGEVLLQLEVGDGGSGFGWADEIGEIFAKAVGIAPVSGANDVALGVDDEFGVVTISKGVFDLVIGSVGEPGPLRVEAALRFFEVKKAVAQRGWLDQAVALGVGEGFIDVVEFDLEGREITMDRFQTGNVTNEGWSSEAAKNDDRIVVFEFFGEGELVAIKIVSRDIGDRSIVRQLG